MSISTPEADNNPQAASSQQATHSLKSSLSSSLLSLTHPPTNEQPSYKNTVHPSIYHFLHQHLIDEFTSDSFLHAILSNLPTPNHLTIITTTPTTPLNPQAHQEDQPPTYAADDKYQSALHIDLKRDLSSHVRRASNSSSSLNSNAALFEKYGFLSPGIFMGGLTVVLLFLILYVGVTAIAGLEIPVMAFSKEMGPSTQKKQQ